jgi:hypothetical protein
MRQATAAALRLVLVEEVGGGNEAAGPPAVLSCDDLAGQLSEALDHLGLERVVAVGLGAGANIVVRAAVRSLAVFG